VRSKDQNDEKGPEHEGRGYPVLEGKKSNQMDRASSYRNSKETKCCGKNLAEAGYSFSCFTFWSY